MDSVSEPICPHCTATTLVCGGIRNERQRYKCKTCGRSSYGAPAFASPPPPPCLRCGEPTRRGGQTEKGTPTYRCTACRRRFVLPVPPVPKFLPNGRRALCHLCGSDDLVNNGVSGTKQGRQRYKCRACRHATYGYKPVPVKPLPCPYCGAQCKRKGRDEHNLPRYRCRSCRRHNTDLFPSPTRGAAGTCRWRRSFCLDMASAAAITTYCNTHVMNMSQAIRGILHAAADEQYATPVIGLQLRTPDGGVRHALHAAPARETPLPLPKKLPDLRPQAAHDRMIRDPEIRHKPMIYIVCQVTVALDDKAYKGLLRTMKQLGLNHQQAARYLITETGKPTQTPIAITGRDAYRTRATGTK